MIRRYVLVASLIGVGSFASADNDSTKATAADGAGTSVAEQDIDLAAAEKIYRKICRACHGNDAGGAASYPGLSDLEPDYIAQRLRAYRSGERVGPNSILMIQPAKKLSDADIANLSVFVATAFD